MNSASRVAIARQQIDFAHHYTLRLLDGLAEGDWFRQPTDGVSHIAWQLGHLAMAEYALTMIRIRGKEPDDERFISGAFFKTFKKGTTPVPDAASYPPVAEIVATYDAVHRQAMDELANYSDDELDVKLPEPHAVFDTKLGSIFFCASHEMLHAGQIGLIRRSIGYDPVR